MSRWLVKLFALLGTFLLPLICTLMPYKVSGYIAKRGASGKQLLSYLMCFGGGIFFGTYLLHMGPEVQTILKDSLLDPYGITYPVAELIVGVGFFIVLFVEKVVLRCNKRRMRLKSRRAATSSEMARVACVNGAGQTSSSTARCSRPASQQMCPECIDGKQCSGDTDNIHQTSSSLNVGSQLLSESQSVSAATQHRDFSDKDVDAAVKDIEAGLSSEIHGAHHHHVTRSLVLILALSLHRIFEGISIGLQQTVANVASLFAAVMCHEMVIGFSLGLQFVRSGFALRRLLITSVVCSVIMPLGVFIGLVMTELQAGGANVDIANGLLQAIAMGTFIYVTFFEILQEEVDSDDTSLAKIVCIAAGFALMALLSLIPEDMSARASLMDTTTAALPANATLMA